MKTSRGIPPAAPQDPIDAVVRRFQTAGMCQDDAAGVTALRDACMTPETWPAGSDLMREGHRARALILLDGWAARAWHLPDGRRQILNFYLPGDVAGFTFGAAASEMTTVTALTAVRVAACTPLEQAMRLDATLAGIKQAVEACARTMEHLLIDQVVRLGRRTAYERMCHLLLELHARLAAIGRAQDMTFAMPLTQETLADATGLSIVHVNRTLQQLRRDGLLELRTGEARLLEPELMAAIADYRAPSGPRPASRPAT
jgi:CRP-like cAMP-binding protein